MPLTEHKYDFDSEPIFVLLADDDEDDRRFFVEAFNEIKMRTKVKTVNDGDLLMKHLNNESLPLPDLLFLDLNMPMKNGFECLYEIRHSKRLKDIAIVIYSTSGSEHDIEEAFVRGANVYIKKPNDFTSLKNILKKVMQINWHYHTYGLDKENFLLSL